MGMFSAIVIGYARSVGAGKRKLACILCVLAGVAVYGTAFAGESIPECVRRSVVFDGLNPPLQYGKVSGDPGAHIALHPQDPDLCSASDGCTGRAYLIPGDVVAVAKACGGFTYVQYIGIQKITTGWIESQHLIGITAVRNRGNDQPHFTLSKGRGLPVCEAYLQRLNQTAFGSYAAYCGRPENGDVPGFTSLHRISVPTAENNRLRNLLYTIIEPRVAIAPEYDKQMNAHGGTYIGPLQAFPSAPENVQLSSWRYEPWIDINNDGKPVNVLIWNEDTLQQPSCSHPGNGQQIAVVLTADGSRIDQAKTMEIFGHPDGGYYIPKELQIQEGPYGVPFLKSFRIIGESYSIFEYRNLYYFDTFLNADVSQGDFKDERKGDPKLNDSLGVFLRQNHKTQQVCEFHVDE
jgi:hypothetical protein